MVFNQDTWESLILIALLVQLPVLWCRDVLKSKHSRFFQCLTMSLRHCWLVSVRSRLNSMTLPFQMGWSTAWTPTAASRPPARTASCAGAHGTRGMSSSRATLGHLPSSPSMTESSSWWGRTALTSSRGKTPSTAGSGCKCDALSVQLRVVGRVLLNILFMF